MTGTIALILCIVILVGFVMVGAMAMNFPFFLRHPIQWVAFKLCIENGFGK